MTDMFAPSCNFVSTAGGNNHKEKEFKQLKYTSSPGLHDKFPFR